MGLFDRWPFKRKKPIPSTVTPTGHWGVNSTGTRIVARDEPQESRVATDDDEDLLSSPAQTMVQAVILSGELTPQAPLPDPTFTSAPDVSNDPPPADSAPAYCPPDLPSSDPSPAYCPSDPAPSYSSPDPSPSDSSSSSSIPDSSSSSTPDWNN